MSLPTVITTSQAARRLAGSASRDGGAIVTAHQHRRPGTIPRTLVPPDRSTVSMRLPGFGTPAWLQWRRCCASGWRPTSRRPKRSWRRSASGSARRRIGAAAAAHGTPGDRPNAVPAVSRCRTRQHHGRAVTLAPGTPAAGECHSDRGRNAAHRRSAASPWLSSARERASTPSAQSLPLILVHCESRRMASVARSGDPDRAAARNQLDQTPVSGRPAPRRSSRWPAGPRAAPSGSDRGRC